MAFDVDLVRSLFPALDSGTAHFDGPGGSQTPSMVAEAVAGTLTSSIANRGRINAAARRADDIVLAARAAMGDLLATDPDTVVFGRSMTALTYDAARAMAQAQDWGEGDEVVVTSLDHDANIRPWVQTAQRRGAMVRWAELDPATGELPVQAVRAVLSDRTRLVAVTGASNLIGTRPDVPAIAAAAHEVGAVVCVDAVHLTPHAVIDRQALGADLLTCSPYKFFGPHLGVLTGDADLLESLHPDQLAPSPRQVPERFELGTLPYELLAGTTAAVEMIAGLGSGQPGRRAAIEAAMGAIGTHEDALRERAEQGLGTVDGLVQHATAASRTPTLLLTVDGVAPGDLAAYLAERGVNAPASHFYAIEAADRLGLGEAGGLRVGMAPYTTQDEVDRLVDGVRAGVATLRR